MDRKNTVYTPRFESQAFSRIARKCAPKVLKAKTSSFAGPSTEIRQMVGTKKKAERLKTAKRVSLSRKEERFPKTCTPLCKPGQIYPESLTEKKEIVLLEEPGPHIPQKQAVGLANVDVFSFVHTEDLKPSKTSTVKQCVLRTISKMLEENRVIRRRLVTCSQAVRGVEV